MECSPLFCGRLRRCRMCCPRLAPPIHIFVESPTFFLKGLKIFTLHIIRKTFIKPSDLASTLILTSFHLDHFSTTTREAQIKMSTSIHLPPSSTQDNDNQMFTVFEKLPVELRFKIWAFAARLPQTVGLRENTQVIMQENGRPKECGFMSGTLTRCPLLLTCREARNEVLKSKKDYFETNSEDAHALVSTNLEVDTLVTNTFLCSRSPFSIHFHFQRVFQLPRS